MSGLPEAGAAKPAPSSSAWRERRNSSSMNLRQPVGGGREQSLGCVALAWRRTSYAEVQRTTAVGEVQRQVLTEADIKRSTSSGSSYLKRSPDLPDWRRALGRYCEFASSPRSWLSTSRPGRPNGSSWGSPGIRTAGQERSLTSARRMTASDWASHSRSMARTAAVSITCRSKAVA